EQFLSKLALAPTLFPESADSIKAAADRVRGLTNERTALGAARDIARSIFDDSVYKSLHPDARARIEADKLEDAFRAEGPLRSREKDGVPADVAIVARLEDALAIHRAHELARGDASEDGEGRANDSAAQ